MKTAIALIIVVATIGLFTASRAESKSGESKTGKEMPTKTAPTQAPAKVAATKPSAKSEKTEKAPKGSTTAAPEKVAAKNPLTPAQSEKLLTLLNEGSPEELATIPGIAKTRAVSIAKARPFAEVGDLILVDGVGAATYEKVLAHGKTLTQAPKTAETAKKS